MEIFSNVGTALLKYQHPETGMWYQIVDQGGRQGNYLESSVTCMLSYAFAKGVRMGLLPAEFMALRNMPISESFNIRSVWMLKATLPWKTPAEVPDWVAFPIGMDLSIIM